MQKGHGWLMTESHKVSSDAKTQQSVSGDDGYPEPTYAWYVVGVLTLAYMVSFLDPQVMALLIRLVEEAGSALLLVTHNREMAAFAHRRYRLSGGHLHGAGGAWSSGS